MKKINCPYCKEAANIEASRCPHCGKNIGIYTLAIREPKAFLYGIVFAIIGTILSYFFHTDTIRTSFEAFNSDPGCCLCCTTPLLLTSIFIMFVYFIGGFIIGFIIGKIITKSSK